MKRIQSTYLFDPEINAGKMIFLSGPRQVGKTTFVKNRLRETGGEELYFNWDDPYVRREYSRNPHFLKAYLAGSKQKFPLVSFDEIHKHRNWKNILKGLYDIHRDEAQFIITGSARLDYFRQSGDSLVGRYFSYRMLPLGLAEAAEDFQFVINDDLIIARPGEHGLLGEVSRINGQKFKKAFERLMLYGGFPEPFVAARETFSNKWRRDYKSLLVKEDLRDLTNIRDVKGIEQLLLLLPERAGSPLSVNSLKNDLQVNHKTAANWLEALKKIYLVFSIMPWSKGISKAIKREQKFYFYDWTIADGEGGRFENLTAVSLLRLVNRFNEFGLGNFELRYIRNQQGREVDFVIIKDSKPLALFEAKKSGGSISKDGMYFSRMLKTPYYQLIADGDIAEAHPEERYILSAWRFMGLLG